MVKRLTEMREAVEKVMRDHKMRWALMAGEWTVLEGVVALLVIFDRVIR